MLGSDTPGNAHGGVLLNRVHLVEFLYPSVDTIEDWIRKASWCLSIKNNLSQELYHLILKQQTVCYCQRTGISGLREFVAG